jgi:FdhE protein
MGRGASSEVAARDFQTLTLRRAERARLLAARYAHSQASLSFLGEVAEFQAAVNPASPLDALPGLVRLAIARAPQPLADLARNLDRETCQAWMDDYLAGGDLSSARTFFARVLLQPAQFGRPPMPAERLGECPACTHLPQAGALKPLSHGQELWLVCSLCFHEWVYPRGRCIACGQTEARSIAYHSAEALPHIQVMSCDGCRQYIHLIDVQKEPSALADIDEVAALPLDVWAVERGYAKLQPNLVGI